jgi:hypothetical protein
LSKVSVECSTSETTSSLGTWLVTWSWLLFDPYKWNQDVLFIYWNTLMSGSPTSLHVCLCPFMILSLETRSWSRWHPPIWYLSADKQEHNCHIMDAIQQLGLYENKQLFDINAVWLHLQVITLSDIVDWGGGGSSECWWCL